MRANRAILTLSLRDFVHERRISLCLVLGLMAVLAPLLLLFGLKFGLVDTLAQRLLRSPDNREVIAVGSRRYYPAWFQRIAARPDVAFLVPNTRRIAASLSLVHNLRNDAQLRALQMIPSGPGDPLLPRRPEGVPKAPQGLDQLLLSATAAQKLGAQVGDTLSARIDRRRQGREEAATWDLTLIGILPPAAIADDAALVSLDLLVATEDYRDGVAVAQLAWDGEPPPSAPRQFARFRLYAKDIYSVAGLAQALRGEGIDLRTRAGEIASMQALDRNLSRVFWLIAAIGCLGFLASLAANLLANVERKRRELSIVRLIGFPTSSLMLFPVVQALLVGVLGTLSALAIYWPVALTLNAWFAVSLQQGERICRLLPWHILAALVVTLLGAALAAAWAGAQAAHIEPSEGLRDV